MQEGRIVLYAGLEFLIAVVMREVSLEISLAKIVFLERNDRR